MCLSTPRQKLGMGFYRFLVRNDNQGAETVPGWSMGFRDLVDRPRTLCRVVRAARDYVMRSKSLISIAIMPAVPTEGAAGTARELQQAYIERCVTGRTMTCINVQVTMQERLRA
jgi:hypothetical protein